MSFKCSVFGHRYGDPDVEREREEQGSEVVISIKETETCKRCGETRVVSENKEVTTLETPSDIVGDDIDDSDDSGDEPTETAAESGPVTEQSDPPAEPDVAVEGSDNDAEFIDETEDPTPAGPEPTEVDQPDLGAASEEAPDADEDDGVILGADDEDDEDETREPGQWPDELDDEEDEKDDWSPSAEGELRPVEDEQPDIEPTNSAVTVPDGEFYCPECDFTTDVESSSLRAGDFCPECHRGSLTHQSDES